MILWIHFPGTGKRMYTYDSKEKKAFIRDVVNAIKAGYEIHVIP